MVWLKSRWLWGSLGIGILAVGVLWGLFVVPYLAVMPGVIAYRQAVDKLVNTVVLQKINRLYRDRSWLWVPSGLSVDGVGKGEYIYSVYGAVEAINSGQKELRIRQPNGEWFNVGIEEGVRGGVILPVFMVGNSWQTIYSDTGWVVSRPKQGIVYDPSDLATVICQDDLVRLKWRDSRPPQFWATWNGGIRYDVLSNREIMEELRSKMEVYRILLSSACADNFYYY